MCLILSKATAYAIHCLHFITQQGGIEPVGVRIIAEQFNIPYDSALRILRKLMKAQIVRSVRGSEGGFALRISPDKISLLDVVEAVDGPIGVEDPLPLNVGDKSVMSKVIGTYQDGIACLRKRLGRTKIRDLGGE